MVWIVNALGEREPFDEFKVMRTCMRAGAGKETAEKISKEVASRVRDGMQTREILRITLRLLDEMAAPHVSARYDLKGAIMRLGPAGFAFESFFAAVLRDLGYQTDVRQIIQGKCIPHEVDVVARSPEGKCIMVECKYRNYSGDYIKVKDALYTYARFLDLKEGHGTGKCANFDEVWLATNTKFSSEVRQYAECKGMRYTSRSWVFLLWAFAFLTLSFPGSVLARDSIGDILARPAAFDGRDMLLEGKASAIDPRTSRRGNEYFTFRLSDATGASLKVFSRGKLTVAPGDRVEVRGRFQRERRVGRYTFTDEVEAAGIRKLP